MVEAAGSIQGELIAAETELEGLKQIYTGENVRVRTIQARVEELRRELAKMGGKAGTTVDTANPSETSVYPTIRALPLLGVSYADLLRRTKVEEVVFETLTQEYEQAKVDEAKELPSEKVLDPPDVPEKKAFPPRPLITFLGGIGALTIGVAFALVRSRWEQGDPKSPGKAFARQVARDVRNHLVRISHNGVGPLHEDKTSLSIEAKDQKNSETGKTKANT